MMSILTIQSSKGAYDVYFRRLDQEAFRSLQSNKSLVIVDEKVHDLHQEKLSYLEKFGPVIVLKSLEMTKSFENIENIISTLLEKGAKRGMTLIGVGGGVIQDVTCFISEILFRGLDWYFVPTTLLAQCDSCIGSKSSINLKRYKNIVGTFTPPKTIIIDTEFLRTLDDEDIASGIGEILKVHMVSDYKHFDRVTVALNNMDIRKYDFTQIIYDSLLYKKAIIEEDEFDRGIRNLMNYGHTFGHALESATGYKIPHGIAVTLGMHVANSIAFRLKKINADQVLRWNEVLTSNFYNFDKTPFSFAEISGALKRDKKNTHPDMLTCVLPEQSRLAKVQIPINSQEIEQSYKSFAGFMK